MVFLLTSFVGVCPAYMPLGIDDQEVDLHFLRLRPVDGRPMALSRSSAVKSIGTPARTDAITRDVDLIADPTAIGS